MDNEKYDGCKQNNRVFPEGSDRFGHAAAKISYAHGVKSAIRSEPIHCDGRLTAVTGNG